jgi:hypothetical protein
VVEQQTLFVTERLADSLACSARRMATGTRSVSSENDRNRTVQSTFPIRRLSSQ